MKFAKTSFVNECFSLLVTDLPSYLLDIFTSGTDWIRWPQQWLCTIITWKIEEFFFSNRHGSTADLVQWFTLIQIHDNEGNPNLYVDNTSLRLEAWSYTWNGWSQNSIPNYHTRANKDKNKHCVLHKCMSFQPPLGSCGEWLFTKCRTTICC